MVALALDIGETDWIAVSSRDGKMAMPVKVLPAAEVTGMSKTFRYLVEDYEPRYPGKRTSFDHGR